MPRSFRILHPSMLGLPWWFRGKEHACNAGDAAGAAGLFLGQENPLEKEMATHYSILAWKIPWGQESQTQHIYASYNMQMGRVTC